MTNEEIYQTQTPFTLGGELNLLPYPEDGVTLATPVGNYANKRTQGLLQIIAVGTFESVSRYVGSLPDYDFIEIQFMPLDPVATAAALETPDIYGRFVSLIFKSKDGAEDAFCERKAA